MNKQAIVAALLSVVTLSAMAQTEEAESHRRKENWAVGGVLTLLAPEFDYYDKNLERYGPPTSMVWFGASRLNDGLMGDRHAQFHLRSGVFNKIDCGFTILQLSRNIYRGFVGVSAGLQMEASIYHLCSDYSAEKNGHRVDIAPSDEEHKNGDLSFTALRIPLLIGAQTNNRLFSIQTGLGLYHTTRFGAQWLVTAGLGPLTINYSQHLTPLFKMTDGTQAYPSSLTIGVDIWYYFCRFTHSK